MTNWKETTLGDVATIKGGKRLPLGDSLQKEKNLHPYIKVTNVSGNAVGGVDEYVPDSVFEKIKRYTVDSGDIILSIVGTIGLVGKIPEHLHKASLTENCVKILPNEDLNSDYLFYFLSSRIGQAEISKNTVGAVQPKLPIYGVQNIEFLLPPIEEQKEIAGVLGSLDDKIELLREENKTLEATAQTIFKEWFVNFNFPNIEGKPYKSSGGKMIDSELGNIPEGWRVIPLDSIFDQIVRGFTTKYVEKSNLINLNQKVNRGDSLEHQHYKYYPEETIVPSEKFAKYGDILINSLGEGTLGRVHFYIENTNNVVVDQHISILRNSTSNVYREYIYLYLTLKNKRLLDLITGTTGMLMLNISQIRLLQVPLPSEKTLIVFHALCDDIYQKKSNNNSQIQTLSTLRDTLLPKLMSGEIEVNW